MALGVGAREGGGEGDSRPGPRRRGRGDGSSIEEPSPNSSENLGRLCSNSDATGYAARNTPDGSAGAGSGETRRSLWPSSTMSVDGTPEPVDPEMRAAILSSAVPGAASICSNSSSSTEDEESITSRAILGLLYLSRP